MSSEPQFYCIQGVPVQPGQSPGLRREFTAWAGKREDEWKSNIQVSLFIQALQKFYDISFEETLSYFQIAGIHGYPGNTVWDGSDFPEHERDDLFGKHMLYCTHNLVTFPTWHRPYMLLFEQRIYELMGDVIEGLKFASDAEKRLWKDEASKWRLPYWDWAIDSNIPALFQNDSVLVCSPGLKPDGSPCDPVALDNPLYRYQLIVNGEPIKMGNEDILKQYAIKDVHDEGSPILPWSKCSGTSRWGIKDPKDEDIWSPGVNNFQQIKAAIESQAWYTPEDQGDQKEILSKSLGDLVYRLLCTDVDWPDFSTTASLAPHSKWEKWVSLEYIHNNLHGFIGGDNLQTGIGHMQNVPSAAFDPIFYMHHANTLNWARWFTPLPVPGLENPQPSSEADLTPFHFLDDKGVVRYYNSDDVREWWRYGYDYDVLAPQPGETRDSPAYLVRIKQYVETTYASTGRVLLRDEGALFKEKTQDSPFHDYIIDVLYDRYALGGAPYTIHFYFGPPVSSLGAAVSVAELRADRKYIGSVFNFSTPLRVGESGRGSCDNCKKQRDGGALSTASIPLTVSLYQLAIDKEVADINDIHAETVEEYLKKHLHWVTVSLSGNPIPWDRLGGTKVFVLQGKGTHYLADDQLSDYESYQGMHAVTELKPGGASENDYKLH